MMKVLSILCAQLRGRLVSRGLFAIQRNSILKTVTNVNIPNAQSHMNLITEARRFLASNSTPVGAPLSQINSPLDHVTYERVCAETLNTLSDYFEELTENAAHLKGSDVAYGDGVLTVNLGKEFGTYVINRQTPNKQIWLSSPSSGPKRYDFVGPKTAETGKWIYKHTGESMHELLQRELEQIFKAQKIDLFQLPYSN